MPDNKNHKEWLYNTMKDEGVEVPSYDVFNTDMDDENIRKWYYDKLGELGYDAKSREEFDSAMGYAPATKSEQTRVKKMEQPYVQAQSGAGTYTPGANVKLPTARQSLRAPKPTTPKPTTPKASARPAAKAAEPQQRPAFMPYGMTSFNKDQAQNMVETSAPEYVPTTLREAADKAWEYNNQNDEIDRAWEMAEQRTREKQDRANRDYIHGNAIVPGQEAMGTSLSAMEASNRAIRMSEHDIERMAEDAWNNIDRSQSNDRYGIMIDQISEEIRSRYPNAREEDIQRSAEGYLRAKVNQLVWEKAVEMNAPKSATDYFFRKVVGANAVRKIEEGLSRSIMGTTGDMYARELAEQRYEQNGHKFAGVAGTVVGMAVDPMMWIAGGVGSAATKGSMWLGGKIVGEAAARRAATTFAGKVATRAVGGAANFAAFEGMGEALDQYQHGGVAAEQGPHMKKIGEVEYLPTDSWHPQSSGEYSVGDILGKMGHGAVMGGTIGVIGGIIGNVSENAVHATNTLIANDGVRAAAKSGIRTGELGVSTVAEGTIFAVPDMAGVAKEYNKQIASLSDKSSENYIADEEERAAAIERLERKRKEAVIDVWDDSMVMMLGFKAHGAIKSAPKRIAELSSSGDGRRGFVERLNRVLDGSAPELALTKDEEAELDAAGYTDLKELTKDYKDFEGAKGVRVDAETGAEVEGELPYNRFTELMQDGRVSEAARAKMYYYLSGKQLPMSTVMGSNIIENTDENGRVSYTVQSFGANGIITSKTYTSKSRAEADVASITRQAELNSLYIGERYYDYMADKKDMHEACKTIGEEKGVVADMLYDMMQKDPADMSEVEREWAEEILGEYYATRGNNTSETLRNGRYAGIDGIIGKPANKRSEREQQFLKDYIEDLYADAKRERMGEDPISDNGESADFKNGYNATPQEAKDIYVGLSLAEREPLAQAKLQEEYRGVMKRIADECDYLAAMERKNMEKMQHKDDKGLHEVVLNIHADSEEGDVAYIVNGSCELNAQGEWVGDKSVVVYDPATGELKQMFPATDFKELGHVTSAEEVENGIMQGRQRNYENRVAEVTNRVEMEPGDRFPMPDGQNAQVIGVEGDNITVLLGDGTQTSISQAELQRQNDEAAMAYYRERFGKPTEVGKSNNGIVKGAPASYEPGMSIIVKNDDGNEQNGVVVGRSRSEGMANYVEDPNGPFVTYVLANGLEYHDTPADLEKKVSGYVVENEGGEELTAKPASEAGRSGEGGEEPIAEGAPIADGKPIAEGAPVASGPAEPIADTPAAGETPEVRMEGAMPIGDDGNPMWLAAAPADGHEYLYNNSGLERDEANEFVAAKIAEAEKAAKAIEKKKPKVSTDLAKYKAEKEAWQNDMDAAQGAVDYWKEVKGVEDGIEAEVAARIEEEQRAAEEARKAEEAERVKAEEEAKAKAEAERVEAERKSAEEAKREKELAEKAAVEAEAARVKAEEEARAEAERKAAEEKARLQAKPAMEAGHGEVDGKKGAEVEEGPKSAFDVEESGIPANVRNRQEMLDNAVRAYNDVLKWTKANEEVTFDAFAKQYEENNGSVIAKYDKPYLQGLFDYVSGKLEKLADEREKKEKEVRNHLDPAIGTEVAEHLNKMGIDTTVDVMEYQHQYQIAKRDKSEAGKPTFFTNKQGKRYGFVRNGKIYLDPRHMEADMPIHEYSHLWCKALELNNPKEWENIIGILKGDETTWNAVKEIVGEGSDSDVASELISKFSGERGSARINEEIERMRRNAPDAKASVLLGNALKNIKKAIQDFWKAVSSFLNIKYTSAEQVYDQVLADFASGVNPIKAIKDYIGKVDKEYESAVINGDAKRAAEIFNDALAETIGNGSVPFISVDRYRKVQSLAHAVKIGDKESIRRAAELMAPLVPKNAVLIPMVSHTGKATDMLALSNAIADIAGCDVADILESGSRDSQYESKKQGRVIPSSELGIRVKEGASAPEGKIAVVVDNVVGTGNTAKAAIDALGKGVVLSLGAANNGDFKSIAELKSANPIEFSKDGKLIPLSERFNVMNIPNKRVEHNGTHSTIEGANNNKKTRNNGGLVENEFSAQLGDGVRRMLDTVGKQIGRGIEIAENIPGGASGYYSPRENKIYISGKLAEKHGEDFVRWTLGHEVTHAIKNASGELYDMYVQMVKDAVGAKEFDELCKSCKEAYDAHYKKVRRESGAKISDITDDEVVEEVVADWASNNTMRNEEFAEKLIDEAEKVGADPRSVIKKVIDTISSIIDAIKGIVGLEDVEKRCKAAIEAWKGMYEAAVAMHNKEISDSEIVADNAVIDGTKFSLDYAPKSKSEERAEIDAIIEQTGRSEKDAKRWVKSQTSLANIFGNEMLREYLDYAKDDTQYFLKKNSDYPQGSVDFNNICRKRIPATLVWQTLQRENPNRILTAEDLANMINVLRENGYEVPCSPCFVEDRRQKLGEIADAFIKDAKDGFVKYGSKNPTKAKVAEKVLDALKGYTTEELGEILDISKLITLEGNNEIRKDYPEVYDAFVIYNNARGQQAGRLFVNYAEYKREILDWNYERVQKVNLDGGLRIFSTSDFEAHHLLDIVQIIQDCATKGVKIQGYTKVPSFARVMARTGAKINMSLIPAGIGYHEEGGKIVLDYDPIEGIDVENEDYKAIKRSNPDIGNIIIGINDEHIRHCMKDDNIDFIIPFHTGLKMSVRKIKGIDKWVNYKLHQTEKLNGKAVGHADAVNIYADVIEAAKDAGEPMDTKEDFVNKYLQVCKERGFTPKYAKFLDKDSNGDFVYTEGYHKFLVDFKLFDNKGKMLPFEPVRAEFDDALNRRIVEDYVRDEKDTEDLTDITSKVRERLGLDDSRFNANEYVPAITVKDVSVELNAAGNVKFSSIYKGVPKVGGLAYSKVHFAKAGEGEPRAVLSTSTEPYVDAYLPDDCFFVGEDGKEYVNIEKADKYIRPYVEEGISHEVNKNESTRYRDGVEPDGTTYEERVQSARRAGYTKKQYDAYIQREWNNMRTHGQDLVDKLGLTDKVEIVDTIDEAGRKGRAKGWFDEKTGKITVVMMNNGGSEDICKTILHEAVGHYGLRELFGERFDTFLDNVYEFAEADIRRGIDGIKDAKGVNEREATEELLSQLAEETDFEGGRTGFWEKVRSIFLDMMHKIGLDSFFIDKITVGELKYILWRSYKNLTEPGRFINRFKGEDDAEMRKANGVAPAYAEEGGIRFRDGEDVPVFVSNAARALDGIKQEKATPEQWMAMLTNAGGIKAGEDKWMGLSDWLKERAKDGAKSLTKDEVARFVAENAIQIEDVEYGKERYGWDYNYFDYDTPRTILRGTDAYYTKDDNGSYNAYIGNELIGTFYDYEDTQAAILDKLGKKRTIHDTRLSYSTGGLENNHEIALVVPTIESYKSSDNIHFGDAGDGRAVAWARFGDTTDADGKRVLVIDEIQSKRHQDGREKGYGKTEKQYIADEKAFHKEMADKYGLKLINGYAFGLDKYLNEEERERLSEVEAYRGGKNDFVPDAPFDKNWHEVAMKRMLRYAAENGYDKVAWTKGAQQAERYNLSSVIDGFTVCEPDEYAQSYGEYANILVHTKNDDGTFFLNVNEDGIVTSTDGTMEDAIGKHLSEVVGKEVADKLMNSDFGKRIEASINIGGGEGMKGFYDKMLPAFMNKYCKKWGTQVGEVTLPNVEEAGRTMWAVDVTQEMRESVMTEPQPMFRGDGEDTVVEKDKETLKALDKEPVEYGYRNVEMREEMDMLSPMGAKLKGNGKEAVANIPFSFLEYERSVEHPELVDENGKIDLVKANGKPLSKVDYNPYIHIRPTKVNYQFAEAWNRPGLIFIKTAYPKSELESGYQADKAKLAVGRHDWNGGELILSRWDKPVGIVPWSEIADDWMAQYGEKGVPFNRLHPMLVPILESRGMKILPPDGNVGAACKEAYESWRENGTLNTKGAIDDARIGEINKMLENRMSNEPRTMREAASEYATKLNANVNIIEDAEGLTGRKAKAKGWYDMSTGEVNVVIGNHKDVGDVIATISHEVIGHKGLRELVGEEGYDAFLDEVYDHLEDALKERVDERWAREHVRRPDTSHEQKRREAVDELLAEMAEKPFEEFSEGERTLWQKIKRKVRELLDKLLGGGKLPGWFKIGDNEIRYMLWRSKEKMERGKEGPIDVARDIVKREELGLDFKDGEDDDTDPDGPGNGGGRPRTAARKGDVTETPEFKKWFGDSKVVDGQGRPLTLYHSTISDFNVFEEGHRGDRPEKSIDDISPVGWFSNTRNTRYGGIVKPVYIKMEHPYTITGNSQKLKEYDDAYDEAVRKMNEYPIEKRDSNNKEWNNLEQEVRDAKLDRKSFRNEYEPFNRLSSLGNMLLKGGNYPEAKTAGEALRMDLESAGYDGVIIKDTAADGAYGETWVMPFNGGSSIKSVDNTTFDPENDDIRYRDGEEEELKDIMKDGSMGMAEKLTAAKLLIVERNREDAEARRNALRSLGGNLADIRRATGLQKQFDKTTVKRVADLARVMVSSGLFNDIQRGEMRRLLSIVKNSAGKDDLSSAVNTMYDMMLNNNLNTMRGALDKLTKIKAGKVDAKGVEVQGKLDVNGQIMLKAYKKGVGLNSAELEDKIADAMNRMASEDDSLAEEASMEYMGLTIARDFVEGARECLEEIDDIKDMMRHARRDTTEQREYYESLVDAERDAKIDLIESYANVISNLGEAMKGSIERAKSFVEEEKDNAKKIQHFANSDTQGKKKNEHYQSTTMSKIANGVVARALLSPLSTFDQMLRLFGSKSANGEGYLYNHFMRGVVDARTREIKGYREKCAILDDKVRELFGGKVKNLSDLISYIGKMPKMDVMFMDGGSMEPHKLNQGNLMYIYMVDKMSDGRMKLRKMGITSESVEDITNELNPKLRIMADWIQEEFLIDTRNEYNKTHKALFGAPMSSIENYFPLKINSGSRTESADKLDIQGQDQSISTTTGSIIKRRRNNLALDLLNANAIEVLVDHISQMEHWNAYASFNRDLNVLRTYTPFRNKVKNMNTVYGSGEELWDNFNRVCRMAAGTYDPAGKKAKFDKAIVNVNRNVAAAKVSFRLWTAIKQLSSIPAFFANARADYMAEGMIAPWKAWEWAMDNLPIFEERWKSRMSGDPRLMKSNKDWKSGRANAVQVASRIGMSPNAFMDALAVSIGSYAIYKTKFGQYKREGFTEEYADKRAKQDAVIAFNQSQQSNEGPFTAPVQVDRTVTASTFTLFRNASMGYQRQAHDALRNTMKTLTPGYRGQSIAFMEKQLMREGLSEEQAKKAATRRYARQVFKNPLNLAIFGWLLPYLWDLMAYAPYLIFGDDDEKKSEMKEDAWQHSKFGWLEGLAGGDVISEGGKMLLMDDINADYLRKDLPLTSDLHKMLQNVQNKKYQAVVNDIMNIIVQIGIGVNPQSATDIALAIMDACGNDVELAHEATIMIARIAQVPQSQIEGLYFDEVGLSGDEVSKYTPAELAKRYAEYKVKRGAIYSPWTWEDEDAIEKKEKTSKSLIKERVERLGEKDINDKYLEYEEVYKELSEIQKEAKKWESKDFVRFAQAMDQLKSDKNKYDIYMRFKELDKTLNKLVERYMKAQSGEEAAKLHEQIIEYKSDMVKKLEEGNN